MRPRPELFIEFRSPSGGLLGVDSAPWEPSLNDALVAQGIKARSLSHEAERLSIALRALFEPLTRRYNDDYFNSVLIELVQDMGMNTAEIEDLMPDITSYKPSQGVHRDECRDDIKATLAKVAKESVEQLRYSRGEALDILTAALAEYLDERFSVTSRRKLGWAKPSPGFWTLVANLAPGYPGATRDAAWTASAWDIATYLRSENFNTTAVTVERELLEQSANDSSFPWSVTLDPITRSLRFIPKTQNRLLSKT